MVVIFVIVTGVGTCGSSAIGGILFYLGIDMGIRLKSASNSNPKGYFEDIDYFDAIHHSKLIGKPRREALKEWFSRRMEKANLQKTPSPVLGLKAPHFIDVCDMTVSVMREVVPDIHIKYIISERSLEEVAQSKMVKYPRPDLTITDYRGKVALLAEKLQNFFAWNEANGNCPMLRVHYDDLLENREDRVRDIASFVFSGFSDAFMARLSLENKIKKAAVFVDPRLKRFQEEEKDYGG